MLLRIRVKRWQSKQFKEIGRGGEAVVYRIRNDTVAKVFFLPGAVEFNGDKKLQMAARVRIEEMQKKLFDIPSDLPKEVVLPSGILVNSKNQIFGYTMPFIDGITLDKLCRTEIAVTAETISKFLLNLYDVVNILHEKGFVIGDFNENNLIVVNGNINLIDVDSAQFGSYCCRSFVPRFTPPEILKRVESNDSSQTSYSMIAPQNKLTDWYSFLVIAMRLLTRTDPYGGTVKGMNFAKRFEKRITIFDRRVVYPVVARPLKNIPRPILEVFFRVFRCGERFIPERELFNYLGLETKKKGVDYEKKQKKCKKRIKRRK